MQVRAGHRPVHAWFLEITMYFYVTVSICLCLVLNCIHGLVGTTEFILYRELYLLYPLF